MERFIVNTQAMINLIKGFKIQYGEIYRIDLSIYIISNFQFKIQYGEIYSIACAKASPLVALFKIQYGEIYSVKC